MKVNLSIDSGDLSRIAARNIAARVPENGEYVIPIGMFKGYPISQVNEIDPTYIAYLGTIQSYGREPFKTLVSKAIELTTLEKRNKVRQSLQYCKQKKEETKWLIDFLQEAKTDMTATEFVRRFSNSIQVQLLTQHRIDLLSFKQLKIIASIWGERNGGKIGTAAYEKAKDAFKEKMRPYWFRKHQTIDDI